MLRVNLCYHCKIEWVEWGWINYDIKVGGLNWSYGGKTKNEFWKNFDFGRLIVVFCFKKFMLELGENT